MGQQHYQPIAFLNLRMERDQIFKALEALVEAWCDRRCYGALRIFLSGWPLVSGLTDDWAALLEALRGVRARAAKELTIQEADVIQELIGAVSKLVYKPN